MSKKHLSGKIFLKKSKTSKSRLLFISPDSVNIIADIDI